MAKEKLKRKLAESGNTTQYSLTTDIRTSFANDAYISLTVHFIDECWELRSYMLATYPLTIAYLLLFMTKTPVSSMQGVF